MALVLKDRVRVTSTTAGTGAFTLGSAATGYQDFSVIGTGNTTYYTIADQSGANWEVGLGTYTSPNQLSRDTVYESSNSNNLVDFGAGTKDVFVTLPAEGFASPPAIGGTTPNTITGTTITANDSAGIGSFLIVDPNISGVTCVFTLDPATYNPTISATDGSTNYPLQLNDGVTFPAGINLNVGQSNALELRSSTNSVTSIYSNNSTYTPYSLYLPSSAGSNNQVLKTDGSGNLSWTNKFVLGAGTATAGTAPLKFTSGTNLTTPETGAMEYDGSLSYFTPVNTSRALLPNHYYYRKNTVTTLSNATGNQSIFALTNGVTVAANTIYEIECEFQLNTTGTTSHTESFGFSLTTATVTNMGVAVNRLAGSTTSTAQGTYLTSVTPVAVTGALTAGQQAIYRIKGTIAFGTGGSINPVIAFSAAPGGTSTVPLGMWMKVTPIGTTGSNVVIGTWS